MAAGGNADEIAEAAAFLFRREASRENLRELGFLDPDTEVTDRDSRRLGSRLVQDQYLVGSAPHRLIRVIGQ